MLHEFLTTNRTELIARCRSKVGERKMGKLTLDELEQGIALFLDQLIKTLEIEQTSNPMQSRDVSGASGGENSGLSEMGQSAAKHGLELMLQGVSIDQVVHEYGDVCQSITDLAFEREAPISVDEFRTLNRCLDNAIAGAVTEYETQRDSLLADQGAQAWNIKLGTFAHELRNHLSTAMLAVSAIKSGGVGMSGATGAVLDRCLIQLSSLIDRSLADVRVSAGMPIRSEVVSVSDFVTALRISASLEADARECQFVASVSEPDLAVNADRDLLHAAVGNLLQNAFRCTQHRSEVTLKAYPVADRIMIDVEDRCGGLPPGAAETMFTPFQQNGRDRSGMGLGLAICRRSVEAINGELSVRDLPGSGCVFRIDLPRHVAPISVQ